MATVWLARDLKHDRLIALKVLRPELATTLGPERFLREVHLAARLQHPHILTVLDSGETAGQLWFTMPYVEGESLRTRLTRERQLPLDDALRITWEAADALEYAHQHGIVHRDIKPENILLTGTHALVADFGIARALGGGEQQLTETGMAVGTPAYMSPEQAAGEGTVDPRTDIYSLGVVLYEMLAGEPPYTGATAQAMLARRLSEAPRPLRTLRETIPEAIDQAVQKALAKTPADRFTTAAQFAQALTPSVTTPMATPTIVPPVAPQRPVPSRASLPRRMSRPISVGLATLGIGFVLGLGVLFAWRRVHRGGEAAGLKHLAVLPFENQGDSADAYFADGITDELRGKLATVPGLEVIASRSSNEYRRTSKSLPEIARDLRVDYVLVGKIRWEKGAGGPGRVRVSPELIRVAPGAAPTTRWEQPFDAALTDVFQVQADIASRVAQALNVALGVGVPQVLAARPTTNPEAYGLYLRANQYLSRESRTDNMIAVQLYERAIALDSGFALAWAKLAQAHAEAYWLQWDPSAERSALARHAAERALALQPDLPEGHLAMGFYHYWGHRDYDSALAEFAIASRGEPNNADLAEAIGYVQRRQGKWQEALASLKRAAELDPLSHTNLRELGVTYGYMRDYPEAERVLDRAIALAPDLPTAYVVKMWLYASWEGHFKQVSAVAHEALRHMEFGMLMAGAPPPMAAWLAADSAFHAELATLSPAAFGRDLSSYFAVKATAYRRLGEIERSRAYYDSLTSSARAVLVERPDEALIHGALGIAEAYLGQRTQAIQAGQRAIELLPLSKDAVYGPIAKLQLATIYTVVGQSDAAVDQLQAVLAVPSPTSPAALKADPSWAPLRGNPRFGRLVGGN